MTSLPSDSYPSDSHPLSKDESPSEEGLSTSEESGETSLASHAEDVDLISTPSAHQMTEGEICQILQHGEMDDIQMLPYSSNYNLLTLVTLDGMELTAVYKPQQGESPLWDFTSGTLCKREVAAYVVSSALGWSLIPPTILRDGNYGIGSVQLYIEHDDSKHYFTVQEDERFASILRKLALFDFITNNADRKSGHCLIDIDGRLWAIDHGICFHHEYKLRTVIWEFSGNPIEPEILNDLELLRSVLDQPTNSYTASLSQLLSSSEQLAMVQRLELLLESGTYPTPLPHRRNYPWPPV
ncbi:MAG: SCO1664 family protein [Chloroflexota bacterium]